VGTVEMMEELFTKTVSSHAKRGNRSTENPLKGGFSKREFTGGWKRHWL
jgi:hypothetical protein